MRGASYAGTSNRLYVGGGLELVITSTLVRRRWSGAPISDTVAVPRTSGYRVTRRPRRVPCSRRSLAAMRRAVLALATRTLRRRCPACHARIDVPHRE
jgi:hypothetical protein